VASDVIPSLAAKRSELARLVIETERALTRLKSDLAHVEGALKIFEPLARPSNPRSTQVEEEQTDLFGYGEIPDVVTQLLKQAIQPMSAAEITKAALRAKRIEHPTAHQTRQCRTRVARFLSRMKKKGKFAGVRYDGRIMLWSLKSTAPLIQETSSMGGMR
jgi:hypothetical protein